MQPSVGGPATRAVRLVIVGGGFSGIGMAVRLRQQGIDDFVILERARELGGTWRDNSYPGCACDVQSALYSFSFAPNPDWSRSFSPQGEIWSYLRRCATAHDIDRHFVYDAELTGAVWDARHGEWQIESAAGRWRARALILANGPLSDPVRPSLAGIERFAGPIFHSAQWAHDVPLGGARVAVIGTGASAIQFVPRIQPAVARLHLFQRTPPWIMPRNDHAIPAWRRALYRRWPLTQRVGRAALYAQREMMFFPFRHRGAARAVEWLAKRHLMTQVADPELRRRLTPQYHIGCKRILLSDDYLPAMSSPNAELVTDRIVEVTSTAIVTADGRARDVGVIVFATGFRATDPPLAPLIRGRGGLSLADSWEASPAAYMGTTTSGFPNLFFLLGPNTGLGHSSVVLMIEAQIEHILQVLAMAERRGDVAIEPSAEAQERYVRWLDDRLAPTVWNRGGCKSWYLDATGRNSALWPYRVGRFSRVVKRVRRADYVAVDRPPLAAVHGRVP